LRKEGTIRTSTVRVPNPRDVGDKGPVDIMSYRLKGCVGCSAGEREATQELRLGPNRSIQKMRKRVVCKEEGRTNRGEAIKGVGEGRDTGAEGSVT